MSLDTMHDLLVAELKDLYSAENQLLKLLPKMVNHATTPALAKAFEDHLEQTQDQVDRLEEIFEELGQSPKGKRCMAMEGLLAETAELLEEDGNDRVLDAALIASAQRVEHYEIAAYGSAAAFARRLKQVRIATLLEESLGEERDTDMLLTAIAESSVNPRAPIAQQMEQAT